jgi:hypothetical protein
VWLRCKRPMLLRLLDARCCCCSHRLARRFHAPRACQGSRRCARVPVSAPAPGHAPRRVAAHGSQRTGSERRCEARRPHALGLLPNRRLGGRASSRGASRSAERAARCVLPWRESRTRTLLPSTLQQRNKQLRGVISEGMAIRARAPALSTRWPSAVRGSSTWYGREEPRDRRWLAGESRARGGAVTCALVLHLASLLLHSAPFSLAMRPALARLAAAPQPAPPRRPRPSHPAAARAAAAAAARPALKGQQASSPSLKIGAGEQKSLWGSWTSEWQKVADTLRLWPRESAAGPACVSGGSHLHNTLTRTRRPLAKDPHRLRRRTRQ